MAIVSNGTDIPLLLTELHPPSGPPPPCTYTLPHNHTITHCRPDRSEKVLHIHGHIRSTARRSRSTVYLLLFVVHLSFAVTHVLGGDVGHCTRHCTRQARKDAFCMKADWERMKAEKEARKPKAVPLVDGRISIPKEDPLAQFVAP